MADIIKMPLLSDTMKEGLIVAWLKSVGDSVEAGDELFEVETDKAVMVQESYWEGTLLHIHVQEGNAAPIDGVIAVIGEKGEDYKPLLEKALSSSNGSQATKEEAPAPVVAETQTAQPEQPKATAATDSRIKASPLARKMAEDNNLSLANLKGSGENGRIVKRDIEAQLQQGAPRSTAAPVAMAPTAQDVDHPVTGMRRIIAQRLGDSKFSAPHFYLTISINMDKAMESRKRINEVAPQKISFNDLVVKAAAVALKQHPAVNSSWFGDFIRVNGNVNIGVAVAVGEGLLVPVVRNADTKSLSQINAEVRDLAGKAKERRIAPEQMQGNTFTISNLGMMGIEEFTAIINPPDACILAVGTITEQPVVKEGQLAIGNIMKVTLSCDHRVVDGATGAAFLKTFKLMMEDPIRLLV